MFKLWKNVLWINFSEPQIYGYRPFHSKHPPPLLNTPPLIKAQIWNWDSGMLNTPPCLRQIWECEKKRDFFFRLDKHPPPTLFSESQNRQGGVVFGMKGTVTTLQMISGDMKLMTNVYLWIILAPTEQRHEKNNWFSNIVTLPSAA